tara:strand:+ start:179 stop:682 length:504 start_codon:yes stop_codon:yes gene_type:complete
MLGLLRRPAVIILSFLVAIALVFGFQAWTPLVGGEILDRVASVEATTALLSSMTEAQKDSHFWMTLLLDYAFPVAYGAFFAGLALRFPGRFGVALAIPAFLVFGFDVAENTVQLIALTGEHGLLFLKALLTPAKFFTFNVAAVIALMSLIWLGFKAARSRLRGASSK